MSHAVTDVFSQLSISENPGISDNVKGCMLSMCTLIQMGPWLKPLCAVLISEVSWFRNLGKLSKLDQKGWNFYYKVFLTESSLFFKVACKVFPNGAYSINTNKSETRAGNLSRTRGTLHW